MRPWEGYRHGRGLDTRGLARLLGEFDVKAAHDPCVRGQAIYPQRWCKR
jgi:hypothetical protein